MCPPRLGDVLGPSGIDVGELELPDWRQESVALLDVVYHCMDGLAMHVGCLSGKNRRFQAVSGGRWGGTVVVVTTVASYVVFRGVDTVPFPSSPS